MSELPSERDAREIRQLILQMLEKAKSGHAGGALDMADVFAVLYRDIVKHNPQNPVWSLRDRVVLSNGHICAVLYAALFLHGYFSEELLWQFRQINGELQGHPHQNLKLGIETTSGPLGQGLSQAVGMALAAKYFSQRHHIFALLSDGEHQEGQTWEAYLSGAKYDLDNLTVIVDRNYMQISGVTEQIMPLDSLAQKLTAMNWRVYEINGHDHEAIRTALKESQADGSPSAVIAYTEPGKGVAEIEHKFSWHGYNPGQINTGIAIKELNTLGGQLESQYE